MRLTTVSRLSVFWIGPIWAAATVMTRMISFLFCVFRVSISARRREPSKLTARVHTGGIGPRIHLFYRIHAILTRPGFDFGGAQHGSLTCSRRFGQCVEVARHPLTASGRAKLRLLRPAAIEHEWTAGVEAAAAGWIDRARHVA